MPEGKEKMDILGLLRLQAANHILANLRLGRACAQLPDEAFFAPRPCFFGSIHATLDHLVVTDRRYLERIDGTPHPPTDGDGVEYQSRDELADARRAVDMRLRDLMSGLTPADMDKPILLHDTERYGRQVDPLWLILQHVFAHATHHRGQVHDLLSQTDVKPPQLDEFILSMDVPFRRDEVAEAGVGEWMIEGPG